MIILPIEIENRELRSKLNLAAELAKLGRSSIIIPSRYLSHKFFKNCTILLKSAADFEFQKIALLAHNGNKLSVLDEEGIIHIAKKEEAEVRFSQRTIDYIDELYFNGNSEKDIICTKYDVKQKWYVTGNPRFDKMPKPKISLAKKPILITSRFGDIIPDQDIEIIEHITKLGFNKEPEHLHMFEEMNQYNKLLFKKYKEMVIDIIKTFPDKEFIFRPHPSEALKYWIDTLKNFNNVRVTKEHDIKHWLERSSLHIHNGCTTAIEAYLASVPTISYQPIQHEIYDLDIPNSISVITETPEQIKNLIKNDKKYNFDYSSQKVIRLSQIIHNIGSGQRAARNIAKNLSKLDDNNKEYYFASYYLRMFFGLKEIYISVLKRELRNSQAYSKRKCPDFNHKDQDKVKNLLMCTDIKFEIQKPFIIVRPN